MKLEPVFDRIIIKRDGETLTAGGIILPESNREKMNCGTIISKGPMCVCVDVGDKVIFPEFAGNEFNDGQGQKFVLLTEDSVEAKIIQEDSLN